MWSARSTHTSAVFSDVRHREGRGEKESFYLRRETPRKVAPLHRPRSGTSRNPLDGADGACGAHKADLGAVHPYPTLRGSSAPSVRSAAVGPPRRARLPPPTPARSPLGPGVQDRTDNPKAPGLLTIDNCPFKWPMERAERRGGPGPLARPRLRRPHLPLRTPRAQRKTCCRGFCDGVQHDGVHH